MSRPLRIQYPGAIYHVMSRGNGQGDIFFNDMDRQDFLQTLAEACPKTSQTLGWLAHRVHWGTRKSFSVKLHRWRKVQEKAPQ